MCDMQDKKFYHAYQAYPIYLVLTVMWYELQGALIGNFS